MNNYSNTSFSLGVFFQASPLLKTDAECLLFTVLHVLTFSTAAGANIVQILRNIDIKT